MYGADTDAQGLYFSMESVQRVCQAGRELLDSTAAAVKEQFPGLRVCLHSGGHTHAPALSVQVWDDRPPADGGVWEAEGEAGMDVPSGPVGLKVVAGASR